jgi:hypothetical protein
MDRDRPWLRHYGSVPQSLDYPEVSHYRAVADAASRTPGATAWDFFDRTSRYGELIREIDQCAGVLASLHLQAGDRLLIAMPTCPQAVVAFYAANRLGRRVQAPHGRRWRRDKPVLSRGVERGWISAATIPERHPVVQPQLHR